MGLIVNGAIISNCGKYRYRLWRRWGDGSALVFIMLNPSTANEEEDDPTIRKCIGFAKALGHGAIEVVNLYAYRATDPKDLKAAGYPVGPSNDDHIRSVVNIHGNDHNLICAWGANARGLSRPTDVKGMIHDIGKPMYSLRLTKDGVPSHPLMLPYSCKPVEIT